MQHGFDGLYMDGYLQPSLQNFKQCIVKEEGCTSFMKAGRSYDCDGDGVADSGADVAGQYYAWGPAFVALMRQRLGEKAILLANSAGSLSDSSVRTAFGSFTALNLKRSLRGPIRRRICFRI